MQWQTASARKNWRGSLQKHSSYFKVGACCAFSYCKFNVTIDCYVWGVQKLEYEVSSVLITSHPLIDRTCQDGCAAKWKIIERDS